MKKIKWILLVLIVNSPFVSRSQSIKEGVVYDTLSTIQNEDFIVNQSIVAFREEGYGTMTAELLVSLVAKRDLELKFEKYWIGCLVKNLNEERDNWDKPQFEKYLKNQQYFNFQRVIGIEFVDSVPHIKFPRRLAEDTDCVEGVKIEYESEGKICQITIDRFKYILDQKLNEYLRNRNFILKK